ncbi:hypothetical protein AX14_002709 [Amanita brunnescens Koide BX004]|nr:hypothetical protein AX14_002709 [Amanita brunnescens Koide BX004]
MKPGAHTNAPKDAVLQPGVDPPFPSEVQHAQPPDEAPSTTLWLKSETAVSNKEMSTQKCSPTAKAATALPNHLPIVTTRAAPSRATKNESKLPLPVASRQHNATKIVSPILTARNNACLATEFGVQSASNKGVNRPGVSSPFRSELMSPASHMPPVHMEVLSAT